MARKDRLSAILTVLFSALAACLALQLPIGKVGRPGPGIFPLVLSIVIGLLGLLLLSRTIRVKAKAGTEQGI